MFSLANPWKSFRRRMEQEAPAPDYTDKNRIAELEGMNLRLCALNDRERNRAQEWRMNCNRALSEVERLRTELAAKDAELAKVRQDELNALTLAAAHQRAAGIWSEGFERIRAERELVSERRDTWRKRFEESQSELTIANARLDMATRRADAAEERAMRLETHNRTLKDIHAGQATIIRNQRAAMVSEGVEVKETARVTVSGDTSFKGPIIVRVNGQEIGRIPAMCRCQRCEDLERELSELRASRQEGHDELFRVAERLGMAWVTLDGQVIGQIQKLTQAEGRPVYAVLEPTANFVQDREATMELLADRGRFHRALCAYANRENWIASSTMDQDTLDEWAWPEAGNKLACHVLGGGSADDQGGYFPQ